MGGHGGHEQLTGPFTLEAMQWNVWRASKTRSVYQIADCMLPMCCDMLPLCLCWSAREGRLDAIFHILQSCIGRPEITAVDLLGNKIVTDITLYVPGCPGQVGVVPSTAGNT